MKKKMFVSVLCLSLIVSLCGGVGAAAAESEDERSRAVDVLVASGWSEEDINDLIPEEALLEYANAYPAMASEEVYLKVGVDDAGETVVEEIDKTTCIAEATAVKEQREIAIQQELSGVSSYTDKDSVTTDDGYLKYYVQAAQSTTNSNEYILSARYEWIVEPEDRDIDVFGLGHSAQLDQTDSDVYYRYKCEIYMLTGGQKMLVDRHEVDEPTAMCIDNGGTAVSQDLYNNSSGMGYVSKAENHRGYIQYRAEVNSTSATRVSVFAEYLHQEAVFSVSPSVSYPLGASISVSSEEKFVRMSPNPYLSFRV